MDNYRITIRQYDREDNLLSTFSSTAEELFVNIPNYQDYYYRVAALEDGVLSPQGKVKANHFCVSTSCMNGVKYCRKDYINSYLNYVIQNYYKDYVSGKSDSYWYPLFDALIAHCGHLDRFEEKFTMVNKECLEKSIGLLQNSFKQLKTVNDLKQWKGVSGIYILIFDEYNFLYIGQAEDIKNRIMRHWSRWEYFSGTGVDILKALDTTRIFAINEKSSTKRNILENEIVNTVDAIMSLNILNGGGIDYLSEQGESLIKPKKSDSNISWEEYFDLQAKKEIESREKWSKILLIK